MPLIEPVAWLVALPPLLVTLVVSVEVLAGMAPEEATSPPATDGPSTVLIVPAHNEAEVIGATLERLAGSLSPGMGVLVVADNCVDETAAIARAAQAEVVERHDAERRGKGFALEFGRDHLTRDPPEVVIVIDADCSIARPDLAALAAAARDMDAPVQACDLIRPSSRSPLVEISTFAFAIKNRFRQRGLQRIGATPMLAGTGMAFPWRIFATAPLATSNITEDLQLGLDLLKKGERPRYLGGACVWSEPGNASTTMAQRSRWESGFLATASRHALPTLFRGIRRLSWPELWAGLHLMTPPLALLCVLNVSITILLAILAAIGGSPAPLAALLLAQGLLALGLALAWRRLGTEFLSWGSLVRLPLYVVWKIPLYLRVIIGRGQRSWVRADRSPTDT